MKYKLPEPVGAIEAPCENPDEFVYDDAYSADQMEAAYQAGVDSVRYEGELPELPAPFNRASCDNPSVAVGAITMVEVYTEHQMQDYARQAIAGAKVGQSEAKGYKLVPIEPTDEMMRAMTDPFIAINGSNRKAFFWAYPRMLEATPQPAPAIDLSRLDPWVHGLGKAVLAELKAAQPAPAAQPLKERPDFIAGYDAGMADAERMYKLATKTAQPLELSNGEIYTAYIEAANQTLRPQDERIALAFARSVLAAANKKAGL